MASQVPMRFKRYLQVTEILHNVCNPKSRGHHAEVLLCNLKAILVRRAAAGAAGHGTYKAAFLRYFKEFYDILRNFEPFYEHFGSTT